MSSMDPLPPALPPAQKPTRIMKPRPPSWSRPCPAPQQDAAPRLDPSPSREQGPGNVRKMVGRFEHRVGGGLAPSSPPENGAQRPPQAPLGMELGLGQDAGGQPPSPEPPGACPPRCPCGCHQHRPGMVLVWVPAPEGEEPGSDGSASTDEEGPLFRRLLEVTPPAFQSRWSPLQPPAPPPEDGSVVLTSYRSTAQLNGGPARAKPPRRAKGGAPQADRPPPAVPPQDPGEAPTRGPGPPASFPAPQAPPIPAKTVPPTPTCPGPPCPPNRCQTVPNGPACPAPPCPPNRCQTMPHGPACPAPP